MTLKVDPTAFEKLGRIIDDEPEEETQPKPWSPSLSKTQKKIFNSSAKFILAYGNRGGGKSYLFGHKIVRHCYENYNALVVIIVGVRSQATQGGIWDKLELEVLPDWKKGLDLEYKDEKMDEQRYRFRMVRNMHGGWSKIVLLSMPYGASIRGRIRGFEPSMVFVDEITTLDTSDYFDAVVQQVGRRPNIKGAQQYMAACNPAGPSHWVYRRFFELPWEESRDVDGKVLSPKDEWDSHYAVFHLQMEENRKNLNKSYYDSVLEATRDDPIEYKRMVEGEWVDRPSGEAIFGSVFHPEVHIPGQDKRSIIVPRENVPVILGYDLGAVHHAIVFMQYIVTREKAIWSIFDEIVYINEHMHLRDLTRNIMRRMAYWNRMVDHKLLWEHISDNSAFNQFRNTTGSYDVLEVQKHSREMSSTFGLPEIRMKEAPKFSGSRESRVRLLLQALQNDQILFSQKVKSILGMLRNLESENERQGKYDPDVAFKPKRSKHLHPFDALTYPILTYSVSGSSVVQQSNSVKNEIIEVGGSVA